MKKLLSLLALSYILVAYAPAFTFTRVGLSRALVQSSAASGAICIADIGGAGVTFGFELVDSNGISVPIVDGSAAKFNGGSITLAANAGGSLVWLITNSTITDNTGTTHTGCLFPTYDKVRIRCLSGSANVPTMAISFGGFTNGTAGTAGSGYNTGMGPGASSPIQFYVGDYDVYGLGGH